MSMFLLYNLKQEQKSSDLIIFFKILQSFKTFNTIFFVILSIYKPFLGPDRFSGRFDVYWTQADRQKVNRQAKYVYRQL